MNSRRISVTKFELPNCNFASYARLIYVFSFSKQQFTNIDPLLMIIIQIVNACGFKLGQNMSVPGMLKLVVFLPIRSFVRLIIHSFIHSITLTSLFSHLQMVAKNSNSVRKVLSEIRKKILYYNFPQFNLSFSTVLCLQTYCRTCCLCCPAVAEFRVVLTSTDPYAWYCVQISD